jgi:hypothetical protein
MRRAKEVKSALLAARYHTAMAIHRALGGKE